MKGIRLGDYNQLTVVKKVDFGLYLDGGDEGEILLPRRYVPEGACPGDTMEVFIYLDNEERLSILPEIRENVRDYPESNALGDMPSYGFYVRHADNVKLENVSITPRSCNTREMILTDDVKDFSIE